MKLSDLTRKYETLAEVPENLRYLFEEKDGAVALNAAGEAVVKLAGENEQLRTKLNTPPSPPPSVDPPSPPGEGGNREPDGGGLEAKISREVDERVAGIKRKHDEQVRTLQSQVEEADKQRRDVLIRQEVLRAESELGLNPATDFFVMQAIQGGWQLNDAGAVVKRDADGIVATNGHNEALTIGEWLKDTAPDWAFKASQGGGAASSSGGRTGAGPRHQGDFASEDEKLTWIENNSAKAFYELPEKKEAQ